MSVLIALAGWLWGGIPTADWIAARRGIDLRTSGSRNPGANNARRLGGTRLAATVLAAEMAKGGAAVGAGWWLAGTSGAVVAGISAALGNVLNPWRRLRGGQGLGITAGVLVAGAPLVWAAAVGVIAAVASLTRSTPLASVTAVSTGIAVAALDLPAPWGVDGPASLGLMVGVAVVILPKQIRHLLTARGRPGSPAPV